MKATVADLRYRMKDVLKALESNEDVEIFYHGKAKGVLKAVPQVDKTKVREHPFFNMRPDGDSVSAEIDCLRGRPYRDL